MAHKEKIIQYPDWSNPAGTVITRAETKNAHPVWKEYEQGAWWLRRIAQFDITGGLSIRAPSQSKEEADAEQLKYDRCAAWRNALRFAEMLWRDDPWWEYAVFYRPEGQNGYHEAVCVYRVIPEIST